MKRVLTFLLSVILAFSIMSQEVPAFEEDAVLWDSTVSETQTDNDGEQDTIEEEVYDATEVSILTEPEEELLTEPETENEMPDYSELCGYLTDRDDTEVESMSVYAKDFHADEGEEKLGAPEIPRFYRSGDYLTLPALRNQTGGTCWAHASVACAEINMIKQGKAVSPDWSEYHLAYFRWFRPADPLGGTVEDKSYTESGGDFYDGWIFPCAANTLASWVGVADNAPDLEPATVKSHGIDKTRAFEDIAHLKNYYVVNASGSEEDRNAVKRIVMDCGAAALDYLHRQAAYDGTHNSYYNELVDGGGHAVTIVGWDDDFPKEHFKSTPEGNGAWLIRNSWASGLLNEECYSGYFWLSYYDKTIGDTIYGFEYETSDDYDNNYQYDGAPYNTVSSKYTFDTQTTANVFYPHASTAGEDLKAVSFYTDRSNLEYEIEIYTHLYDPSDPTYGTLSSTVTGSTTYPGYHTIPLPEPVVLQCGDPYSVVVTLKKSGDRFGLIRESGITDNGYAIVAGSSPGQSFWQNSDEVWEDIGADGLGNIRIKAFTDDREGTDPADSYRVLFISNNGPNTTSIQTIATDQTVQLQANSFTRDGYVFQGWNTKADGSGTSFADGQTVTNLCEEGEEIALYAQWGAGSCTVTFIVSDGICDTVSKTVTPGSNYGTLPEATPTVSGVTFAGWYTAEEDGVQVKDTTPVTRSTDHKLYARWKIYRKIDANGGTMLINGTYKMSFYSMDIVIGDRYGKYFFAVPTREGYVFAGWYTEQTGGSKIYDYTPVTYNASQTLAYAHWTEVKTYNVQFLAGEGTVSPKYKSVTFGSAYGELPVPVRDGYTFAGWYTEQTGGIRVSSTTIVSAENFNPDASIHKLYAHWNRARCRVTFDGNGGNVPVSSKYVTSGSAYGTLPSAQRTGYTFAGWYMDKNGSTKVTEDTTVTKTTDHTLYALWIAKTVQVRLVNGETLVKTLNVTYGKPYGGVFGELPVPDLPEGVEFTGWYTDKNGGTKVEAGTIVETETNHILYARSAGKLYNVLLNATGGTVRANSLSGEIVMGKQEMIDGTEDAASAYMIVQFGKPYGQKYAKHALPDPVPQMPEPKRTGYSFTGWYTSDTGGVRVYADTIARPPVFVPEDDTTHALYAHWEANTYMVTFDANGGTCMTSTKEVTYDSAYGTLPVPEERAGMEFVGWFTDKIGDTQIKADTIVKNASNHTLYARWKGAPHTVTFDAGAGSITEGSSSGTVYFGGCYGTLPVAEREGYTFDGWFTLSEGGEKVEPLTEVTATAAETLYAHYTILTFTVTVHAKGGKFGTENIKTIVKDWNTTLSETELGTPVYKKHSLIGWTDDADGLIAHDFTVPVKSDLLIYAKWEEIPHTGFEVEGLEAEYVYTGSAIKPEVSVYDYDHDRQLTEKTDYTVTYKNFTNAGTDAKIIITGKGNYKEKKEVTYTITERDISADGLYADEFRADDIYVVYNAKKAQTPNPVLYRNNRKLTQNKDYELSWKNEEGKDNTACKAAKPYEVTIMGKGNYKGSRKILFVITDKTLINGAKVTAPNINYPGNPLKPPVVSVKLKGKELGAENYDILWPGQMETTDPIDTAAMKNVGTVNFTVVAKKDSGYAGFCTGSYKINGTALKANWVTYKEPYITYCYNGTAIMPGGAPDDKDDTGNIVVRNAQNEILKKSVDPMTGDYMVSYSANVNAGTATMTLTGCGRYTGSVIKKFKIDPNPGLAAIGELGGTFENVLPYVKGGTTQPEEVFSVIKLYGINAVIGRDYTVTYKNNKKPGIAWSAKGPWVTVTGKDNYKGFERRWPFTIVQQNINEKDADDHYIIAAYAPNMVYTGKAGGYKVTPTLTDTRSGLKLDKNDYSSKIRYFYGDNVVTKEITQKVKNAPVIVTRHPNDEIDKADIIPVGTELYMLIEGIGGFTSTRRVDYTVCENDFSKLKIKVADQAYTGKSVEIGEDDITFTLSAGMVKPQLGTDYVIAGYSNNINKGTATVIFRGKENYAGLKSVTFKVVQRPLN